eukprot:33981_1
MEAWLLLMSVATIPINTTTKLSYAASTWTLAQINPIQINQFVDFADSPSFEHLNKNVNGETTHLIIENLTLLELIKSECLSIKVPPGERFIKIGIILPLLYGHEDSIQKNRGMNLKMASEIMDIIYCTYLTCRIWRKTTNIQSLTSTCSFTYTEMTIENMKIPHQILLDTLNIKIGCLLKLKLIGTL